MEDVQAAPDFPMLTDTQLHELTPGVFQLKQAKSYTNEHIAENGIYEILISIQIHGLLKVKIQTRHSNTKVYNALVQYNDRTVLEWCCQCPYGNVTIGTCRHIASILWNLGLACHDTSKMKQISSKCSKFLKDTSSILLNDDDKSDDGDDEDDEDEVDS